VKIPNLSFVGNAAKLGKAFVLANRPELLLGASITATIGAVVMAAKGGYEAGQKVMEEDFNRDIAGVEKTNVKEKIQLTWMCYMPAAITTVGALTSTTGLHMVHVKEKKLLATAAMAACEQLENKKAIELANKIGLISDDEEREILEKRAERNGDGMAPIMHTDGEVEELYLVRDQWSGRDIWSNKNRIEEAVNELNGVINSAGDVDLNTFYTYAGFGMIPQGEVMGWGGETLVTLKWETPTVRDDGRPVVPFTFRTKPKEGFSDPHR
jgi:hypothetical protein